MALIEHQSDLEIAQSHFARMWQDRDRPAVRDSLRDNLRLQRAIQGHVEPLPAYCEDFPCCGHEAGDCNGQKYGSDESIKARAYERMRMEDEGYFFDDEESY